MTLDRIVLPYIFDLELSGRCNTICSFCPRHEMKRGEAFMSDDHFSAFYERLSRYVRAFEKREAVLPHERARVRLGEGEQSPFRIILCGMGESLMHRRCAEWIGLIRRELGIRVTVVTNGLLLKQSIIERLVESNVTVVLVSVPGIDEATYARYMRLEWSRILDNIDCANVALPGRVQINATIPDDAPFTEEEVIRFWEGRGIPLAGLGRCHNRGGFLDDPALTGRFGMPTSPFCGILARHFFVAWDGRVLSCCHDLHAENVLGHVTTDEFVEIARRKTPMVVSGPSFRICGGCNDGERGHAAQILTVNVAPAPRQSPFTILP